MSSVSPIFLVNSVNILCIEIILVLHCIRRSRSSTHSLGASLLFLFLVITIVIEVKIKELLQVNKCGIQSRELLQNLVDHTTVEVWKNT